MSYIDIDDEDENYKEKYEELAEELDIAFNMINNYEEERKRHKKEIEELKKKIDNLAQMCGFLLNK